MVIVPTGVEGPVPSGVEGPVPSGVEGPVGTQAGCAVFLRTQWPMHSTSMSEHMNVSNASRGVQTIGSQPRLKLVLTTTGQPVFS